MKIFKNTVDEYGNISKVFKTEKNTWIKTTNKINNPENFLNEYEKFKTFYDLGPKIIEYSITPNKNKKPEKNPSPILTYEMINVEGKLFSDAINEMDVSDRMYYYGKIYSKIINCFYEYSKLCSNGKIYFHGDLKPGNLIIQNDDVNFIDIDSINWFKPTTTINSINRMHGTFSYWINLNLEEYVL